MPGFAAAGLAISAFSAKSGYDASKRSGNLQAQQLQLERERDEFNKGIVTQTNKYAAEDREDIMARRDRDRALTDPIQEGIVDLAMQGPDYEGAMARSDADVAQSYGIARGTSDRNRRRYGVNPASGREAAESRRFSNSEALARVGGRGKARLVEDDKDWARKIAAYGTGNMRNASTTTSLQQVGVSGASGVLGQMSRDEGANAAGAYGLAGKLFADAKDYYNAPSPNASSFVQPTPGTGTYYDPGLSSTEGSF